MKKQMKGVLLGAVILGTGLAHAAMLVEYDWENGNIIPTDNIGPVFSDGNAAGDGKTFIASGISGNGLSFTEDGWATAGSGGVSEFKISSDFTATLWVNLNSNSDLLDRMITTYNSNGAVTTGSGWRLLLQTNNDVVLQANGTGGSTINNTFAGLQSVQVDAWSFVALRYDNDGNATVTVLSESQLGGDAALVAANSASVASDGAMSYGGAATPRLGVNQSNIGSKLNGTLDTVRLYDAALTDTELAESFNTIPEPATFGLLAVMGGAVLFIRRRFMI